MGKEKASEEHAGPHQVLNESVPLPALGHCEENPEILVVGSRMLGHTIILKQSLKRPMTRTLGLIGRDRHPKADHPGVDG